MSTVPAVATEPTVVTEVLETIEAAVAGTEPAVDIESIKEFMDGFDPAALLPELEKIFADLAPICRWAVLIGPILLAVLGLAYLFLSPKEANYYFGYRCYYGMGSVQAWRFTQRMAGITLGGLGLILTGVMIVITGGFARLEVMDMVWKAVTCLVWEAVIAAAAIVIINITAMLKFDRRGEYRNKKKNK